LVGRGDDAAGEPETSYDALMRLAVQKRKKDKTVEQSFARLFADPKYAALVKKDREFHFAKVAKALQRQVSLWSGKADPQGITRFAGGPLLFHDHLDGHSGKEARVVLGFCVLTDDGAVSPGGGGGLCWSLARFVGDGIKLPQ
jgi:hypothetical protein